MRIRIIGILLVAVVIPMVGCPGREKGPAEYPIKGKVVAINPEKPSVKIDHQDIPGLMRAMTMEFDAANAKVLDGIQVGDAVQGKLKVEDGKNIITQLEKDSAAADKEAKIKANLAKLSPEDRKLAEAQKFCPIMQKSRLGSMGTPIKVMIEGQPVFLCCDHCQEKAESQPEKTLATAKKLKGQAK